MAWLYQRSSTWRRIVNTTQQSAFAMIGFTAVAIGVPYYLADAVQNTTNNSTQHAQLEKELRARGGIDAKMLAQAQRERLQVMFDEIKGGKDGERYKAALNGESLGTHSVGSSRSAVSIKPRQN